MVFNSYLSILIVLPVFVLTFFVFSKINTLLSKVVLIVFGVLWYYWGGGISTSIIFLVSIIVNIIFSSLLFHCRKQGFRRFVVIFSIIANIGMLVYFKYTNFIVKTMQLSMVTKDIILPLGISFFTFQQIMFLVSIYRGEIGKLDLLDYLSYILYFPKLIMGPLIEPKDFIDQINDKTNNRVNWENVSHGIKMFSFGLFKKMLFADTFAVAVAWVFSNLKTATAGDLFLGMLFYTFEIYFDFSGYSDMAIGISKMVNINLPMNFDSPYKANSIRDFWKRWHMSLTSFFTKYVYFPLGGSRKGRIRTYINILIIFLLSGIWHGANWTFIVWGCIYGILQVLERVFSKTYERQCGGIKWLYTFLMVNLLWLLFRSESLAQWLEILGKMFSFQSMAISGGLLKVFLLPEMEMMIKNVEIITLACTQIRGVPMLAMTISAFLICLIPENNYRNQKLSISNMILCAVAFAWAFLCLGSESVFVYFNF